MARFFIDRPIFAIVLSLLISIIGVISIFALPITQYPKIALPSVNVAASYIGANAEVVQEAVAQPVENRVNGVEGMLYMQSNSDANGRYSLNVTFDLARDGDMAAVLTQNRVSIASASLPSEVTSAGVITQKTSSDTLLYFALYSPNGSYDALFLKNYGSIFVTDTLKRINGIGQLNEYGSDYGMRIWLNPMALARYGLTVIDVRNAIREQNAQVPAGQLGQYPSPPNQVYQYSINVKGRLITPEEFGDSIVKTDETGALVRLKDIATIELGGKDYSYFGSFNGKPAAVYSVNLTADANAVLVSEQIRTELEKLSAFFPDDMRYEIVQDNTLFIKESLHEVTKTLYEALILVLLVVTLFLQNWRATLIPMLAVPISLIGTFAVFVALGFSINTLTLFALVLAIGIVVDDAIVVVEAVEHHMRHNGLNAREATIKAMEEVTGPIIATSIVLCAVFVPITFLGGMTGVMFRQFGLTVATSVVLSMFVALTLTPALCSVLLKFEPLNPQGSLLSRFFIQFNTRFDKLTERYGRGVATIIKRMAIASGVLLAMFATTAGLFRQVPSTFVPAEDQGYFIISVQLPPATTLALTQKATTTIEQRLGEIDGVSATLAINGYSILAGTSIPNASLIVVRLDDWATRADRKQDLKSIILHAIAKTADMAQVQIMPLNPPPISGLGSTGGFSFMLQDKAGNGAAALSETAQAFLQAARARPEIKMTYTTFNASTPSLEFEVDREKAKAMGVNLSDLFGTLQALLGGVEVNDFSLFGRTYKVKMQAAPEWRDNADKLGALYTRNNMGEPVPLSALVSARPTGAPDVIKRFNSYPAAEINGSAAEGFSSGQALLALEEVAAKTLSSGYGYEWAGLSRQEKETAGQTGPILALALVFVFLCLAALYESWGVPFAVLFAIPLGLFGAMFTLFVTGVASNVYTQVGLVLVIGLAAKNAILIVEFAKLKHEEGLDVISASLEAAKLRLRPILMTSFAFILGVLPLVLSSGAGAGSRVTLGLTVFGGMIAATLLAIMFVPMLYVLVMKLAK